MTKEIKQSASEAYYSQKVLIKQTKISQKHTKLAVYKTEQKQDTKKLSKES